MFFEKLYSNQSFIVSTLDYYKEAKRGIKIFEILNVILIIIWSFKYFEKY